MTRDALQAFRKSIEQKRFDCVYYFHGEEDFRKEAALRAFIIQAVEEGTRDFNLDQISGAGLAGASLGSLLSLPPVLAQRRVVILRDVGALKKDARTVLEQYLRKPADDLVLVLVSPAGEKPDAALQQLSTNLDFAILDQPRLVAWMMEHAAEAHDARLSAEAADLLYATAGRDLSALAAEIDKCVSYGGREIDRKAVEDVVGVRHGETLGDLLGAVARRQAGEALRLVPIVLAQPKNGLVPVLNALGTQLMGIGAALAARASGASDGAVRNRLWELLKASAPNTGGPWGEAVDRWARSLPLWSEAAVRAGLRVLLATDRAFKDSRIASEEQLLTNVVLELCGDVRRAGAAA